MPATLPLRSPAALAALLVLTGPAALAAAPGCGSRAPAQVQVAQVPESTRIDAEMSVRRVARDAYVVTDEKLFDSNALVVRMADDTLVLCSSPLDTDATRAMLGWLRATFQPRRIIAINTHFHLDGTGGNQAYAEAGVETYASELTRALQARRGASLRDELAAELKEPELRARVARTPIVTAAHTFAARDGMTLSIAGEDVRVFYPGPAHSPDNVVVHFPQRGLLFGGCMIKTDSSIGYTGDADLDHWEEAVHALEPLTAKVVVPGHGPIGGPELLRNTIDVVRAARAAATAR